MRGIRTMSLDLDPLLGLPVVYLVDDEDVVRDALAWLLRSRRLADDLVVEDRRGRGDEIVPPFVAFLEL